MVDVVNDLSNYVTTSSDLTCATIVQRFQSGPFHYAFGPKFLKLVAARFYASVEAIELASHLTNREQTSYELKVKESMRIFVKNFFIKNENCLKRFQVVFQLWRVCYITNVEIFEKVGFSIFELKLNNVLDQFFELILLKF